MCTVQKTFMSDTKEKMARTSITVPIELLEDFRKYCDKKRRSVSAQVALLMEKALQASEEGILDDD